MKKIILKNEKFKCKIYKVKNYKKGLYLYNCYVVKLYRNRPVIDKFVHTSLYDNSYNINYTSTSQKLFDETIEAYLTKLRVETN